MSTKLYQAVSDNNIPLLQDCVYDMTQSLNRDWLTTDDIQEFGKKLELSKQRAKRTKAMLDGWEQNPNYYVGVMDGAIKVYDSLLMEEKDFSAIDELFPRMGEKTKTILDELCKQAQQERWISHAELAETVSTSANSLTNIMKRLLQTQTVTYKKEGKYVKYHITPQGELYCRRSKRLGRREEKEGPQVKQWAEEYGKQFGEMFGRRFIEEFNEQLRSKAVREAEQSIRPIVLIRKQTNTEELSNKLDFEEFSLDSRLSVEENDQSMDKWNNAEFNYEILEALKKRRVRKEG